MMTSSMQMSQIINNGLQTTSIRIYHLSRSAIMFRHLFALLAAVCALNAFAAVEVNQASRAELESVKGIGPGLSGKITEARKAGNFKDWSDLVERVGGIGPGNATRFSQAGLTVSGAALPAASRPSPAPRRPDKTRSRSPPTRRAHRARRSRARRPVPEPWTVEPARPLQS
jgi:competence protein ComEA